MSIQPDMPYVPTIIRFAAHRVEQPPEQQWPQKIPRGQWQDVYADPGILHMIERRQHQAIGKEHGVEEERLRHHQGQRQKAARTILMEHRCKNYPEAEYLPRMHFQSALRRWQGMSDLALDFIGVAFCFLVSPVSYLPSGTFGHETS